MNYPVGTPTQLKAVLRALRKECQLSQADLGQLIGVNQKRIAKIEAAPGVTGFDQIARIVSVLGGRLVIQQESNAPAPEDRSSAPKRRSKTRRATQSAPTW